MIMAEYVWDGSIPCSRCGYDLRGDRQWTVRCPECGARQFLPDAALRAAWREADRGRALPLCGAVLLGAVVVGARLGTELMAARVFSAACLCAWVVCLVQYGRLQRAMASRF